MVTYVEPVAYDDTQDALKGEQILYTIRSDKDTDFTTGLALNAADLESLVGIAGTNKIVIRRVVVLLLTGTARDFDFWFFQRSTGQNANLDLDMFSAGLVFHASEARQAVPGTYPQFYYDSGALDIPVWNLDGDAHINTMLVWKDANAYNPGGGDMLVVIIHFSPQG